MRNKIKKAFLIVLPAFYTENSAFLIPFQGISHSQDTVFFLFLVEDKLVPIVPYIVGKYSLILWEFVPTK